MSDNNKALLNWKDSPDGRRSKAQGIDGEYRIGRYDIAPRTWHEHGVQLPGETWFGVQLRGPSEKRGGYKPGYLGRADTMDEAKALAQAHVVSKRALDADLQ